MKKSPAVEYCQTVYKALQGSQRPQVLQDMATVALNDMPKPTSGMCSDREYLVHVLQVMRPKKEGDETFKSLLDRGIEVARGEELVTAKLTKEKIDIICEGA